MFSLRKPAHHDQRLEIPKAKILIIDVRQAMDDLPESIGRFDPQAVLMKIITQRPAVRHAVSEDDRHAATLLSRQAKGIRMTVDKIKVTAKFKVDRARRQRKQAKLREEP